MESTKGLFTHADVQKIIEKRGIDVNTLPTQDEIEHRFYERSMANLNRKGTCHLSLLSLPGNVPAKFTFEKWQPEMQTDLQTSRDLGNRAYKLAKQMQKTPENMILFGPRGTGKTSLALAMLTSLRDQGQSGLFISTAELSNLMSLQYDAPDVRKRLAGIERAMKEADVLLLDDFGTEGGMKLDIKPVRRDMQELMYRVANARLDFESNSPRLSTIITTNNEMSELEHMYNSKLISRLIPKSKECTLNFEDLKDVRGKRS